MENMAQPCTIYSITRGHCELDKEGWWGVGGSCTFEFYIQTDYINRKVIYTGTITHLVSDTLQIRNSCCDDVVPRV